MIMETVMNFKDLEINIIEEIAKLAFGFPEWITSEIKTRYNPYIPEDYEDAREYWEVKFTGYFAAKNTAEYKVTIYPDGDVGIWWDFRGEKSLSFTSNQRKIQKLLNNYFTDKES